MANGALWDSFGWSLIYVKEFGSLIYMVVGIEKVSCGEDWVYF